MVGILTALVSVPASADALTPVARHAKGKSIAKQDKAAFRYLDMVERTRPAGIRNAVIVYDHVQARQRSCDAKSVSECLHSPAT